jgi:hypothetical protein
MEPEHLRKAWKQMTLRCASNRKEKGTTATRGRQAFVIGLKRSFT